jgi:hypothetical protein
MRFGKFESGRKNRKDHAVGFDDVLLSTLPKNARASDLCPDCRPAKLDGKPVLESACLTMVV